MNTYNNILKAFNPVGLEDLEGTKLMNRTDDKYLLHINQLEAVLESAIKKYRSLEINGKRIMGYDSLYFDTPNHLMYLKHHNQKLNRYKVRIRQYLDSQNFFLEVKFKTNTGRTQKTRIPVNNYKSISDIDSKSFVEQSTPYLVDHLEPKLSTSFDRITLINPEREERITLDLNLTLHHPGNSVTIPYLVIAEVKYERGSHGYGFGNLLQEHRIFRRRISKYCLGTNLLFPEIKHNRFKPKILYLNKLDKTPQYDHLYSAII